MIAGAEEHGKAHEAEAALVVAGEVFGEADEVRAEEATGDADHVDGRDAGCGGAALEEVCGQRPERALHGVVGEDEETESRNNDQGLGGEAAERGSRARWSRHQGMMCQYLSCVRSECMALSSMPSAPRRLRPAMMKPTLVVLRWVERWTMSGAMKV